MSKVLRAGVDFGIFDWSGVISDDFESVYQANMAMNDKYGHLRVDRETFRRTMRASFVEQYRAMGATESPEDLEALFKGFFNEQPPPKVFEFAPPVIKGLAASDLVLAVLSYHPTEFLEREIEAYGLNGNFKIINGGSTKSKADRIGDVLEELGADPERTFFAGDMAWDIHAGNQAGVKSVAVKSGYHPEDMLLEAKPYLLIPNISWIPHALLNHLL